MEKINWQGFEWLPSERWGQVHPGNPIAWHNPEMIKLQDDGSVKLGAGICPKKFMITTLDPDGVEEVEVPVGIGLMSCTYQFEYGRFEIEAKLPHGQPYAWPAFWMWAWDSWPPEIDVFEAYTNRKGSYMNWNWDMILGRFFRVATNVHLGESPENYNMGAKKHFFGFKDPSKHFMKYAVEWEPDHITIYYNYRVVRKITDESVLSQFRGKKMNVIINNGIQKEYIETGEMATHYMHVKSFSYHQSYYIR